MNALEQLGKIVASALGKAIEAGMTKREALAKAAEELQREDVVSDELWNDLGTYVRETARFENEGG